MRLVSCAVWGQPELNPVPTREGFAAALNAKLLYRVKQAAVMFFLLNLVVEAFDGDATLLPMWPVYLAVYLGATVLQRRRMTAQPLLLAVAIFVSGAALLILGGHITSGFDPVLWVVALITLGMLVVAADPARRTGALAAFAIAVAIVDYLSAVEHNLAFSDAILRVVASVGLLLFGGSLLAWFQNSLSALLESRDRLIDSISHELRTPLAAVLGFSSVLTDELGPRLGTEDREMLGLVADQAQEAADLVENVLIAARAEAGGLNFLVRPVDLVETAAAIVDRIDTEAMTKAIRVVAEDSAGFAEADRLRCEHIIRNLVGNAGRFGGDDIVVAIRRSGDEMVVDVSDDGPAIAEHVRVNMFDPFVSADPCNGRTATLGLGLHVSRVLAREMSGDLTAHRADGRNVFRLSLPAEGAAHSLANASGAEKTLDATDGTASAA